MYTLKQHKENVSRQLGNETRQRIENKSIGRNYIDTINHYSIIDNKVLQMEQMPKAKIEELKGLPDSFIGITLFHGDDRDYLEHIELSTVNTSNWTDPVLRGGIIKGLEAAKLLQSKIYSKVLSLGDEAFDTYISKWIHSPLSGYEVDGQDLIKPNRFFNGCCCCLEKDKVSNRKYIYEINLTGEFRCVKRTKKMLYMKITE